MRWQPYLFLPESQDALSALSTSFAESEPLLIAGTQQYSLLALPRLLAKRTWGCISGFSSSLSMPCGRLVAMGVAANCGCNLLAGCSVFGVCMGMDCPVYGYGLPHVCARTHKQWTFAGPAAVAMDCLVYDSPFREKTL